MRRWLTFPIIVVLFALSLAFYGLLVLMQMLVSIGSDLIQQFCAWRDK